MPNDSLRSNTDRIRASNTDRIRAACQELENALENFNRTREPDSHASNEAAANANGANSNGSDAHADDAPSHPNSSRLEQIQIQLTNIRRQIDELS